MNITMYKVYRKLLAGSAIRAGYIYTPDHLHPQPAIRAAIPEKIINILKPNPLVIEEDPMMSNTMQKRGGITQLSDQQSFTPALPQFYQTCRLPRNGRIGRVIKLLDKIPGPLSGNGKSKMSFHENLNYQKGQTSMPEVCYTKSKTYPRYGFSRPAWFLCEQFGAGIITGPMD